MTLTHGRPRVAIIDDHELFAQSLALALGMNGFEAERLPIETTSSHAQVLSATKRWKPHVVLLDLDLGAVGDSSRLIAPLAQGGSVVIVLTASDDPIRHGACLAAGAAAVLSKSGSLADIRSAVRRASARRPVIGWQEREQMIRHWQAHHSIVAESRRRFDRLTERERQVLAHLVRGRTVADIARLGVVSETTVRTQVKSILAKLEVSSQIAAVGLVHQSGWALPEEDTPRPASPPHAAEDRRRR